MGDEVSDVNMKYYKIARGIVSLRNDEIDPQILLIVENSLKSKLEKDLLPAASTMSDQPNTTLTLGILKDTMKRMEPSAKFGVNKRTLLSMRRMMRQEGMEAQRIGRGYWYKIYSAGQWIADLLVDMNNIIPDGQLIYFKGPKWEKWNRTVGGK